MKFVKFYKDKKVLTQKYVRVNKTKHYTYIYTFYYDHDEPLDSEHIKSTEKPEYIRIRGGKRAVFYENVEERKQIKNDEVQK